MVPSPLLATWLSGRRHLFAKQARGESPSASSNLAVAALEN